MAISVGEHQSRHVRPRFAFHSARSYLAPDLVNRLGSLGTRLEVNCISASLPWEDGRKAVRGTATPEEQGQSQPHRTAVEQINK